MLSNKDRIIHQQATEIGKLREELAQVFAELDAKQKRKTKRNSRIDSEEGASLTLSPPNMAAFVLMSGTTMIAFGINPFEFWGKILVWWVGFFAVLLSMYIIAYPFRRVFTSNPIKNRRDRDAELILSNTWQIANAILMLLIGLYFLVVVVIVLRGLLAG